MSGETVRLYHALSLLFPKEQLESPGFLNSLNPETLKKTFRAKVMECHPDLVYNMPDTFRQSRHNRFIRVQEAYKFLSAHLQTARGSEQEIQPSPSPEKTGILRRQRSSAQDNLIISIGGAKGGIGKTVLAANISAGLASLGKKVIVVDLDLGGANMHLHLGIKFPSATLQHYFKSSKELDEICLDTAVRNLRLIAGDSSGLGMANILETQKKRLVRDLRKLPADYVVVDLGGDTSYHMVDFFLAADERIAVTSPEPTSVLDVYNFIKVSLLRYLNRVMFQDMNRDETRLFDGDLARFKGLIFQATSWSNNHHIKRIDELLARAHDQNPEWALFLRRKIDSFRPYLVVNMTEAASKDNLATRIAGIAKDNLSINISTLPNISFDQEVKKVVHYLVPILFERPESQAAQCIFRILRTLLQGHIGDNELCRLLQSTTDEKIAVAFLRFIKRGENTIWTSKERKGERIYAGWR